MHHKTGPLQPAVIRISGRVSTGICSISMAKCRMSMVDLYSAFSQKTSDALMADLGLKQQIFQIISNLMYGHMAN